MGNVKNSSNTRKMLFLQVYGSRYENLICPKNKISCATLLFSLCCTWNYPSTIKRKIRRKITTWHELPLPCSKGNPLHVFASFVLLEEEKMLKQTYQKHGKSRQQTPLNANHFVHCRQHHHVEKKKSKLRTSCKHTHTWHLFVRCISQNEIFYFLIKIRTLT